MTVQTNTESAPIHVMPTIWSEIPYMSDIQTLNQSDIPCLAEIREVLKRHNALNRFGVTLVHKHFEIAADEILVERIDFQNRSLTIAPMKKAEAEECVETSWNLQEDDANIVCAQNHCFSTCKHQEQEYREMLKVSA